MKEMTYEELDVSQAIIIGYMMGTYQLMGRGGAQAVANMAGEMVGKELARYAASRDLPLNTWEDLQRFLTGIGLTDSIEYRRTGKGIDVEIHDCRICPKHVGHYDFPGTACPWGGLLAGLLGEVLGVRFTSTPRLTPG
jgi:predicted hydrocarbon binding protein